MSEKLSKGSYLDPKTIDPSKFVFYRKEVPFDDTPHTGAVKINQHGVTRILSLSGVKGKKTGTIHKNVGFNKFEVEATPVPVGFKKTTVPSENWIKSYYWNPNHKWVKFKKVPEYDHKHYFIHDNGGRPFVIYLNEKIATVYKIPDKEEDSYTRDEDYENEKRRRELYHKLVLRTKYKKAFIGKSPHDEFTDFGGGYGDYFDGNSVLLHISGLKYIYVGSSIYKFTALSPIKFYQSSVGNNDVPYPYAIDDQNRYYMMLDRVIMTHNPNPEKHPYNVYYENEHILSHGTVNFKEKSWGNYKGFNIGDDSYRLSWSLRKDFDRLRQDDDDKNKLHDIYLIKKDGTKKKQTKKSYERFMKEYGQAHGFVPFATKTIYERKLW